MKGMLIAYLVKHLDSLVLVGVGMQINPDIEFSTLDAKGFENHSKQCFTKC